MSMPRIPTGPISGRRPKLSTAGYVWLMKQHANRDPRCRGVRLLDEWAEHLGVSRATVSRYIGNRNKFPVRA
jgi:hypothetical protein